jgi:PRTRC genetic system protein B
MTDITQHLGTLYHPVSALVIYQAEKNNHTDTYVEHFDIDANGCPINAHPLTTREAKLLSIELNMGKEESNAFLKPESILSTNILHINPNENGSVVWYRKSGKRKLFFTDSLGVPNGIAEVPAMLWKADKNKVHVFALSSNKRPTEKTVLYHTPFFNVYENGNVCMGTVSVKINNSSSIEAFIKTWEDYFFNSYFSHLMQGHNPVNGNCVTLWKTLVNTNKSFPKEVLKKTNQTIKNLIR